MKLYIILMIGAYILYRIAHSRGAEKGKGKALLINDLTSMEGWKITEVYEPGNLIEVRSIKDTDKDPKRIMRQPPFILDVSGQPELRQKGLVFHTWPDRRGEVVIYDPVFW